MSEERKNPYSTESLLIKMRRNKGMIPPEPTEATVDAPETRETPTEEPEPLHKTLLQFKAYDYAKRAAEAMRKVNELKPDIGNYSSNKAIRALELAKESAKKLAFKAAKYKLEASLEDPQVDPEKIQQTILEYIANHDGIGSSVLVNDVSSTLGVKRNKTIRMGVDRLIVEGKIYSIGSKSNGTVRYHLGQKRLEPISSATVQTEPSEATLEDLSEKRKQEKQSIREEILKHLKNEKRPGIGINKAVLFSDVEDFLHCDANRIKIEIERLKDDDQVRETGSPIHSTTRYHITSPIEEERHRNPLLANNGFFVEMYRALIKRARIHEAVKPTSGDFPGLPAATIAFMKEIDGIIPESFLERSGKAGPEFAKALMKTLGKVVDIDGKRYELGMRKVEGRALFFVTEVAATPTEAVETTEATETNPIAAIAAEFKKCRKNTSWSYPVVGLTPTETVETTEATETDPITPE